MGADTSTPRDHREATPNYKVGDQVWLGSTTYPRFPQIEPSLINEVTFELGIIMEY